MIVFRRYRYRIYPTKEQEQTLVEFAGCRRLVWNWALARKQQSYQDLGRSLKRFALRDELILLKRQPDMNFLQAPPLQVLDEVLIDLDRAFSNFFAKRAKYPRFKSRKKTPHSLRFSNHVKVVDSKSIKVPKIGLIKAIIHRPLEGISKGATIKQDRTGSWYVSLICHIERPNIVPSAEHPVGIDVGLETFMTLHTGIKVKPPKFYRRGERKLKQLHRSLSRKQRGSNNRWKAVKRLARAYKRTRNQRADWLHKQSLSVIRQFDTVCIETLNIRGLVKTKLAKSFSDAAIRSFMKMLNDKAEWHGRQVSAVDRFFPSSKLCHACGTKVTLTLADRIWTCPNPHCHITHDRDINAAINILNEGLRILEAGQSRG
jgi:putative transposase